jgi:hypothetical protein
MASRTEIINEIEALEAHCRAPLMAAEAKGRWLQDWCSDLAEFPIDTIRAAIRDYRQSGATKFPTPGGLLPSIRAKLPLERKGDIPREWAPISEAEYDELSLREKIRHHLISASAARRKAGPMWRNPPGSTLKKPMSGHIQRQDMPEAWRIHSALAERHEAEARRLRAILHGDLMARRANGR